MYTEAHHRVQTPEEKKPRTEAPPSCPSPSTDAAAYERHYVHDVYSAIADHFSGTRYKAWPKVAAFLETLPSFSLIADMGCGNGKYFAAAQRLAVTGMPETSSTAGSPTSSEEQTAEPTSSSTTTATHRYMVGLDYSQELLRSTQRTLVDPNMHHEQARRQYRSKRARKLVADAVTPVSAEELPRTDTVRSDALHSPLRSGVFDAAISIAVIHHYANHDRRVQAVRELLRLVRPNGGRVLLYVWAREQIGKAKQRPVDPDTGDGLVRWERNRKYDQEQRVFHRYYHFFAEGELETLCLAAAAASEGSEGKKDRAIPIEIAESYYDKENWCVVLKRM